MVCGAPAQAWAQSRLPDSMPQFGGTLRPGDELRIAVYRDPELTGKYVIDGHGMLHIPGQGAVRVAGLDPTQLQARIKQALIDRGFQSPDVSVQPLLRVSVLGQISKPNLYSVEPGTNLIQLLTLAGGPIRHSDLRKTRVVRERKEYVVDLESALSGSAAGLIQLYSNDMVFIPSKRDRGEMFNTSLQVVTALASLASLIMLIRRAQ